MERPKEISRDIRRDCRRNRRGKAVLLPMKPSTKALSQGESISSWDVSSVTNMRFMFYNAFKFNSNISTWKVNNVRLMARMFVCVSSFSREYIRDWGLSSNNSSFGN